MVSKGKMLMLLSFFFLPAFVFAESQGKIVVGAKTFTEQFLLAKMLTLILQAEGYEVEEKLNMPTKVLRPALENREVDIYWEYTGTAYGAILKQNDPQIATDAEKTYEAVKKLDEAKGILWLKRSTLNNTWGLVTTKKYAEITQIDSISKLAEKINGLETPVRIGISKEFYDRPDGFKKLGEHYNFQIPKQALLILNGESLYGALQRGQVDVSMGFGTDAKIRELELITLVDDKKFFAAYNAAPVIHKEVAEKYPKVVELANQIGPLLDNNTIIMLNYKVDVEKKTVDEIASAWLKQSGLLK